MARTRSRSNNSNEQQGSIFEEVTPSMAKKLEEKLSDASDAFANERFTEAKSLLIEINRRAANVSEVMELLGLTHYRLGSWEKAIEQFEKLYTATQSVEQHPVWADCYRALGKYTRVNELWAELGDTSPSADIVEEGRIVYAGSLADQDRVVDAIRLLEKAPSPRKKVAVRHLRRWYVMAELYERTGDYPKAKRIYQQILDNDKSFGDVLEKLAAIG